MGILVFDTSYLNKTPNKAARPTQVYKPVFMVWHETGGYGSLEWNLKPEVRSSYNFLIKRAGKIFHYVDEQRYVAWHAGVGDKRPPWNGKSRWLIGSRLFVGNQINEAAIGVEIEGMNNGEPITEAQRLAAIALIRWGKSTYNIAIDPAYHPEHSMVATYYKDDARGYTIGTLLDAARAEDRTPAQIFDAAHRLNGGVWRGAGLFSLGVKLGEPFDHAGAIHQRYERGVGRLEGSTVVWLLLNEIAELV